MTEPPANSGHFLSELRRRRVVRAALVYAAAGFAVLEAADVAFPRLGLPDWTVTFVLALVGLGFPITLGLAWVFDFSADGVIRTGDAPTGDAPEGWLTGRTSRQMKKAFMRKTRPTPIWTTPG